MTLTNLDAVVNCGTADTTADFLIFGPDYHVTPNCMSERDILPERYAQRIANNSVPMILIYGCDGPQHHEFEEVKTLFSHNVTDIFSGAILINWFGTGSVKHNLGRSAYQTR
jgi:hypothetical protein